MGLEHFRYSPTTPEMNNVQVWKCLRRRYRGALWWYADLFKPLRLTEIAKSTNAFVGIFSFVGIRRSILGLDRLVNVLNRLILSVN